MTNEEWKKFNLKLAIAVVSSMVGFFITSLMLQSYMASTTALNTALCAMSNKEKNNERRTEPKRRRPETEGGRAIREAARLLDEREG